MYKAIEAPADQDLSAFSRLLWQRRISHRLHRLERAQVLAVPRPEQVGEAQRLYRAWLSGEVAPHERDSSELRGWFSPGEFLGRAAMAFASTPVTLVLIAVSVAVALATGLGRDFALTSRFLFPDFSSGGVIVLSRVIENFTLEQFLRLFSPMFLHFSLLHIAFNMLWVWELGRRIETRQASWVMIPLVLMLSFVSNSVQFLYSGGTNFGGMSGVVFGLFGYVWMWQLFDPAKGLGMPPGLVFFMLLSLVILAVQPILPIANAAHVGGLVAGVVYGAITATVSRLQRHARTRMNA